jgi:hypothetical protein
VGAKKCPELRFLTHGAPGVVLHREAGAGAHGTRAGPEAALSHEVGTGPELPYASPELP